MKNSKFLSIFWIPYWEIAIETTLTKAQAQALLRKKIKTLQTTSQLAPRNLHGFRGEVLEDRFRISRIIHYRSSFLPMTIGRFVEDDEGMTIEAYLCMNSIVLFVWIVVYAVASISFLRTLSYDPYPEIGITLLISLVLVPLLLTIYETRKITSFLQAIFHCSIAEN